MVRTLATAAGILLLAFGALFLLQGLGVIRWPAESFMIDSRTWIFRGAVIAAIGAVLILLARFGGTRS
ncbi:hypothetical protein IAG41_06080 [Sphingomonas sp. JC676]|uniref:hypothetical protein n=1 Tax=Sphingomonas sp. JC676 TaxID=2768065 RepID=UPI00165814E6|nr:hypothetical protein [Sphingomonas sp. JC676]MBC9031954.1 hypothetical protein [Sphingomonas sp. JC676]